MTDAGIRGCVELRSKTISPVTESTTIIDGSAKNFDLVITVEADLELRKERLRKRGMFISEIERRIAAQATREARQALADFVITNDGDEDQLLRAVENLWEELPSRAK